MAAAGQFDAVVCLDAQVLLRQDPRGHSGARRSGKQDVFGTRHQHGLACHGYRGMRGHGVPVHL
ncbi:hypothetical protein D3C86_2261730 [compost metagenome]